MVPGGSEGRTPYSPLQLQGPLVQLLAAAGSGRADLIHESATRHVWFDGGVAVGVTSDRDDEKLGSWLVVRGLVPPQSVHEALVAKQDSERLGSVLVRNNRLSQEKLRSELESLAVTLLGRAALSGGVLVGEAGPSLPTDCRTLSAPAPALLAAAVRATDDLERLGLLLGEGQGWMVPETDAPPAVGVELGTSERYLLSLLKRPRTLDGLRRAALIDYEDLLRGLAVLALADLIAPCRAVRVPPPSRSTEASEPEAVRAAPATPEAAAPGALRTASGLQLASRRSVREALDALDASEAAPMCDLDGRVASGAQRHRAAAFLESAKQLRNTGGDRWTMRQLLTRALDVFPAVSVMVMLAELEIAELHLRSQGLDRLQRVLAKAPRCTEGWLLLGGYWAERGQAEKLRACAAKILAYDPENQDALAMTTPVAPHQ